MERTLALDILGDVTASRLEESEFLPPSVSYHSTRAHSQQDALGSQVGHDHDVKLLGPHDELLGRIVDDHVVELDSGSLVLLCDGLASVEEETISKLHDVGLVDAGDGLHIVVSERREEEEDWTDLAVVLDCEIESKASDPLRLESGHDLQALYDTRVGLTLRTPDISSSSSLAQTTWTDLVLQSRVLSLRVLTNDGKVDVLVASGETGKSLAEDEGGVDVELLPHRYVPRTVTRPLLGGVQNTCGVGLSACERTRGE
jgi:hypothetical protein